MILMLILPDVMKSHTLRLGCYTIGCCPLLQVFNNPTCGDIDGNGAGQTAFDCAALGNYRAKPGAGTADISALTADDKRDTCCELVGASGSCRAC